MSMLPAGIAGMLPNHEVTTVKTAGYVGLKNGELIRRASAAEFDVLVTADRNLPEQQNIRASSIGLVLVPGNRIADIQPWVGEISAAIAAARPGTVARIGRPA